jgi:hypothetical protein
VDFQAEFPARAEQKNNNRAFRFLLPYLNSDYMSRRLKHVELEVSLQKKTTTTTFEQHSDITLYSHIPLIIYCICLSINKHLFYSYNLSQTVNVNNCACIQSSANIGKFYFY